MTRILSKAVLVEKVIFEERDLTGTFSMVLNLNINSIWDERTVWPIVTRGITFLDI